MIKTAKAYAEDPAVKDKIAELKVVSTGTDAPAQLGAIEDFINQGFDAIVTIAVSPDGFDRVIRLADKNDVVIVPFDNVLDTDAVMQVNEDQLEMGRKWAQFLVDELKAAGQDRRQDPRGPRPARQLGRPRPLDRHPRGARRHRRRLGGRAGRRQLGRRHRPEGHRRRHRRARPVRRRHRAGRLDRHRAGDDGRRPPVRPGRRRVGERLPQADRRAFRRGPQGHLDRPVAGPRRHLDEGGDLGARGQPDAAADLGAAAGRRPTRR